MQKLALLLSIIVLAAGISLAQTSGFTYQGKLAASGAAANGDYQFQFKLFGGATAVDQFGSTQTVGATVLDSKSPGAVIKSFYYWYINAIEAGTDPFKEGR